jgi:hypothetical protein
MLGATGRHRRPAEPRPTPPYPPYAQWPADSRPAPPRWVTELRSAPETVKDWATRLPDREALGRRAAELRRDPYAVFRGRHRRTAVSSAAAGVVLLGVSLAAVPGSAAAQTVRPTTPGASAFTAEPSAHRPLVQLASPSTYKVHGAEASRAAVTVATNLDTAPTAPTAEAAGAPDSPSAPESPSAPAPEPEQQPEPPAAPAPPPGPVWTSPAPGAPVTNPYGVPNKEYAAGYHTGMDFAVNTGTPLLAVGDGTVVTAGWGGAYGNEVVLKLSDGKFALYAHLSKLEVRPGQSVGGGQQIGASGSTGNSTGPHLHFEIRTADRYGAVVDPVGYLTGHGANNF